MIKVNDFVEYWKDQYSSGDLNADNYKQCAYFIRGIIYSNPDKDNSDLKRVETCLLGAANLVDHLDSPALLKSIEGGLTK